MFSYNHLYEEMIEYDVVAQAAADAAQGKLDRSDVMEAILHFDKSYQYCIQCINDPNWFPDETNVHYVIDGSNGKQRTIEKPKFCPEQIIHHMLMEPFKKVVLNGLYEQVYGCFPEVYIDLGDGRYKIRKYGPHEAIKQLTKWAQVPKKIFVAELDIHHAYGSVNISILSKKLQRVIKDKRWLKIMYKFIHYDSESPDDELCGLALGHYTSPWLFNFYLKDFDHFVAAMPGIKYLRYADNMQLIGTNKRSVHKAVKAISEYLESELKLSLNKSWQVFRFEYYNVKKGKICGRAINALGTVIHVDRLTVRKSILLRTRRKVLKVYNKDVISWHDANSTLAHISCFKNRNCYQYYHEYIKPYVNLGRLKRKVAQHSREILPISNERRAMLHDGLEKGKWLTGRTAC